MLITSCKVWKNRHENFVHQFLAVKIYIERESIFKEIYIIYLYVFVCFIFPQNFFFCSDVNYVQLVFFWMKRSISGTCWIVSVILMNYDLSFLRYVGMLFNSPHISFGERKKLVLELHILKRNCLSGLFQWHACR